MNDLKLFVVRKYIKARSAAEAIRKEKGSAVDDVWIDDDWKKEHLNGAIGFRAAKKPVSSVKFFTC